MGRAFTTSKRQSPARERLHCRCCALDTCRVVGAGDDLSDLRDRNTAVVVAGTTDRAQIDALATAGVELTAYRLGTFQELRPTSGRFRTRIGSRGCSVVFQSEASRIDLNSAPKELLAGLMAGLGATASDAAGIMPTGSMPGVPPPQPPGMIPKVHSTGRRALPISLVMRRFRRREELWLVYGDPHVSDRADAAVRHRFWRWCVDQCPGCRTAGGCSSPGNDAGQIAGGAVPAR